MSGCACADLGDALDIGVLHIIDTHKKRYLSGCAPDLAVVMKGHGLSPFNSVLTFELQVSRGWWAYKFLLLPSKFLATNCARVSMPRDVPMLCMWRLKTTAECLPFLRLAYQPYFLSLVLCTSCRKEI